MLAYAAYYIRIFYENVFSSDHKATTLIPRGHRVLTLEFYIKMVYVNPLCVHLHHSFPHIWGFLNFLPIVLYIVSMKTLGKFECGSVVEEWFEQDLGSPSSSLT